MCRQAAHLNGPGRYPLTVHLANMTISFFLEQVLLLSEGHQLYFGPPQEAGH